MIRRYFQNSDVNMTKQTYFEMCEMLGQEPIDDEIPVELSDFPDLVQTCFHIYSMLQDSWDSMAGAYLGKNYTIVFDLFKAYSIFDEEQLLAISFLQQMDIVRQKIVSDKIKSKTPATKK